MSNEIRVGIGMLFLCSLVFASPSPADAIDFVWPLTGSTTPSVINSPFGPRIKSSTNDYEFHDGIDLKIPPGTTHQPVYPAANGSVRLMTDDNGCTIQLANDTIVPTCASPLYPGGGRIVQIAHGNNLYTNYMHLSRQTDGLKPNDSVVPTTAIGLTGQTGNATFEHLHFEVRENGRDRINAKNPLGFLPWGPDAASSITDAHLGSANGQTVLLVTVQANPADLNLNEVSAQVFDAANVLVTQASGTAVNFNNKQNCGPLVANPAQGITLLPAVFNQSSSAYLLTVQFAGLTLPSGGSYEVTARDVSGLTTTVTKFIP